MRPFRLGVHAILVSTLLMGFAPKDPDRDIHASIRHLRRAAIPAQDGSHLLLLSSLRQLSDPTLRSFFYQLSQRGGSPARIHAILGLAEIDETGRVNPWLITQLDSADARYAAIANAVEMDLIDIAQITELIGWDDLEAKSRVMLLAELLRRGESPDPESLARLAESPSLDVAGLAACLLAQMNDSGPLSGHQARVATAAASERSRHLRRMFRDVGTYELTSVLDWVVETVSASDTDPGVVDQGIATVLALDPEQGAVLWRRALGEDPSYGKCIRYALLLLSGGPGVPTQAYDRLPEGDELIDRMVQAGRAISGGGDASAALTELIDLSHLKSSGWAMGATAGLVDATAKRVYLHLMDSVEGEARGRNERSQLAIIATSRLFELDPDAVIERLERAEDDGPTQQAILMGLLESRSPAAGEAASRVRRIGFGEADSLAVILIAKHSEALDEGLLHQLGVIASGGGRVSGVLQIQAAWLYLKHRSKIEQALVETFD